jgi:hypothetical protein
MKSKILLFIIILIIISSCITSTRPNKEDLFPPEANWNFEYYDSFGVSLREGKSVVSFNEEESTFSLKLIEGVFGKNAEITGNIQELNPINNSYHFKGNGTWFEEGKYIIEGDFNSNFDMIYDGAVAYNADIESDIQDLLSKMDKYRTDIIEYENLSEEEKTNVDKPEKPIGDDYIPGFYTWKAELIYEELNLEND